MGSIILDLLGSFILSGILLVTGLKLNISTSNFQEQTTIDLRAQKNCVALGTILEHDLYKLGLNDTAAIHFIIANADTIKFRGDIDGSGLVSTVAYYLGSKVPADQTTNPNLRWLYRSVNVGNVSGMNLGVTNFKLAYYNASGAVTSVLGSIRAIRVTMDVESAMLSTTSGGKDKVYNKIRRQQYIVPKALHW